MNKIKYLQANGLSATVTPYDGSEIWYININYLELEITHNIDNIFNKDFYAHVIGRAGEAPSSRLIYSEILSELDFDQQLEQLGDIELGKYAFTIDKKINSKKLIEELSQSTPLYPYFKDNQFKIIY